MSDDPTTQSNPPAGESTPPVHTPPANPPQSQPSNNFSAELEKFTTALSALPETIAKSVKEAIGTPAPAQPKTETKETKTETTETKTETPKQEAPKNTGTPGKKSFADWWFK